MVSVRRSSVFVRVVYAIGLFAAAVVVLSAALAVVVSNSSDDGDEFAFHVSTPALIVWCGPIVLAAATWLWRRRQARR